MSWKNEYLENTGDISPFFKKYIPKIINSSAEVTVDDEFKGFSVKDRDRMKVLFVMARSKETESSMH